eukprot:1393948-Amorphochlora_amoeboformis.AAC.1
MPKAPTNVRAQDEDGDRGQIRAKRGERLCTVSTLEDIEEDIYILRSGSRQGTSQVDHHTHDQP